MPKDNKNNKTYSEEQKEAMLSKLLPQTACQFRAFSPN